MKLATTIGDFRGYSSCAQEAVQYVCEAGFKYIDYGFGKDYKNRIGFFGDDFDGHVTSLKIQADKLGTKFVQAHAITGDVFAEDNTELISDTIRCIDACGALGIENVVVHSGLGAGIEKEENFEKNKVFYTPLLERAEKYGINILTENFNKGSVGSYRIDNAPDLRELIDYIDHPLFHAVWDTGHGNLQEMPQDEALRILGEHVRAVHVQDNYGDRDIHIAPFFGSMSLDSLMHGLLDIGYNGYFTFEAVRMLFPAKQKREYSDDKRLKKTPLRLRITAERFLYEIGKCILEEYGCFEE